MVVDPAQFRLELLGRVADRAEHSETARAADRGDHVAAMRKREEREFASHHFRHSERHIFPPEHTPRSSLN